MKKLSLHLALTVFLFFIIIPNSIQAQPYLGGEITWQCKANGKFVFQMKLYRECNAITFPNTLNLYSNSPLDTFPVFLNTGYPKEISPVCNIDTSYDHIACGGYLNGNFTGAVQVYVYESAEMQLVGVPPTAGWCFYYSGHCRPSSTNMTYLCEFTFRSIMYSYNNLNTYPCFDSSPDFVELPNPVMNVGYANTLNNNAIDSDGDSLIYEWAEPWKNLNNALQNYKTGYSFASPFPSAIHNANNQAAVLDPYGIIRFKSHTIGHIIAVTKVSSYKNGVKVGEINRDYEYILSNKAGTNLPPTIISPDSSNSNFYTDTLIVGGEVTLYIAATDFQLMSNGSAQRITMGASSPHFGSYIPATTGSQSTLSETSGCFNPPCAKLTPAPSHNIPFSSVFGIQTTFEWSPDCSNLISPSGVNIFDFSVSVKDDYCPIPGKSMLHIRIVVLDSIKTNKPPSNLSYVYMGSVPKAVLQWSISQIDSSSFLAYYIYEASNPGGIPVLIDSVMNYSQTLYDLDNSNVFNQDSYYTMQTKFQQSCAGPALSAATAELPILISDLNDIQEDNHLLVMPNPTQGKFEIETYLLLDVEAKLRIVSVEGKVIMEEIYKMKRGEVRIPVDLSGYANGVYLYELKWNDHMKSGKIILNK